MSERINLHEHIMKSICRWFQYKDEVVYIKPSSTHALDRQGNGYDHWAVKVNLETRDIDVGVIFDLILEDLYLVEDDETIEKIERLIESEEAKEILLNA